MNAFPPCITEPFKGDVVLCSRLEPHQRRGLEGRHEKAAHLRPGPFRRQEQHRDLEGSARFNRTTDGHSSDAGACITGVNRHDTPSTLTQFWHGSVRGPFWVQPRTKDVNGRGLLKARKEIWRGVHASTSGLKACFRPTTVLTRQPDAVVQARRSAGPVLDLVRVESEAAPMGGTRYVAALKACVDLCVLGLKRGAVVDGRGLVGDPRPDL